MPKFDPWMRPADEDRLFLAFDVHDPAALDVLPAWMLKTFDGWEQATDSYGEEHPRTRVLRRLHGWIAGRYGEDVPKVIPQGALNVPVSCAELAEAYQAAVGRSPRVRQRAAGLLHVKDGTGPCVP